MLVLIIVCSLFGWCSSLVATKKGRDPVAWFAIGFAFGILGLIAAALVPEVSADNQKQYPVASSVQQDDSEEEELIQWYYLDAQNEQFGPFSLKKIRSLIHEGVIKPTTYLWHPGLDQWTPAEKLELEKIN